MERWWEHAQWWDLVTRVDLLAFLIAVEPSSSLVFASAPSFSKIRTISGNPLFAA